MHGLSEILTKLRITNQKTGSFDKSLMEGARVYSKSICASLSHTHNWYEVGMFKVPASIDKELYACETDSEQIIGTGWNWNSGNNRVRCSPDWSVYRCIERYCMTPRQRDDDNNLSVGNRNHLKLGIEPESWLQSHELGF